MVYEHVPENFNPKFEAAGCAIEWKSKILLLQRLPEKSEGNKWGLPGGKFDPGETPEEAVVREVFEETSIRLPKPELKFIEKLAVEYTDFQFYYYLYTCKFSDAPHVTIHDREHQAWGWYTSDEASKLQFMEDFDRCLTAYLNFNQ